MRSSGDKSAARTTLRSLVAILIKAKDKKCPNDNGFSIIGVVRVRSKHNQPSTIFPFYCHRLSKLGARSIILTSGTLSPLGAFQEEIGIPFPVQLENKHIISASQVNS
jgi:hypothetical protein